MADGYLTFDTKLNTAGFKSGLGQVTGMFTKLAALAGVAFSVGAVVAFGRAAVQAAGQAEAKFKGLEFLMKANGRSMSEATSFIKEFTADGLVPMTSAYESYKNMVSRGYSTEQIEKMLSVMKDAAVYNRQGQFSMGEAMEKATMGLRMENSLLTDSVGIQKNVAKMWQEYAQSIGTTANNLTMLQKRQAEFEGFMAEGGVFAGAAAEYADSYAGRIAGISAAFQNLKVAVGNAVIPFINALLPAITNAILWFTKLFNIVGRVVNLLFGTNVGMVDAEAAIAGSAEQTAAATEQTAANTEAAGKAAKGALASFDKLNVLAQDTSGGGGGAGAGAGAGGILPTKEDTGGAMAALDEVGEKIKQTIAKIKAMFATGDFSTIGKKLGSALSSAFKGGLDIAIGFLQNTNWQGIGTAIWNGITGAISFVWGLLTGFDWSGFVSKVFELLGSAFGAAAGLAVGLGTAIWNSMLAVWEFVKVAWEGVKTYFKDEIAKAGGDVILGLLIGIANAFINIGLWIYDNIVKPFIEGFKKGFGIASPSTLMAEQGQPIIDGLKKGITDAWASVSQWINDTIVEPLKGWFRQAWADIQSVAEGAWEGVKGKWNEAVNWFQTTILDPISTAFETAWGAIKGFMESPFEGLGEFVKGIFNNVIGFINGLLSGIVSGINGIIDRINSLSFTPPQWAQDLLGVGTVGVSIGHLSTPQIPYLAGGAVIPPNAPFAAVLGDQKRGTNVEAPEALIRQIVREEAGNAGGQNITITFGGTMGELVRQLKPHIERETMRTGGSMMAKAVRI